MISCHDVVAELWDYLDGELPVERATLIADHLAECARCYPQYRFEYAFLAAVARQRSLGPGPSLALIALWRALGDPWGLATAALPACGGLVYLLRERDSWTLDAWLAWRRPWRLVH
ncbi:MAG: zf-HC2 domain-containing protein [Gemmatimonadales bacterium]